MDTRTDDFIGEVQVRSDDNREIKSIELFAHDFRINDATKEIDYVDETTRDRILGHVESAVFLIVRHEVAPSQLPTAAPN